MLSGYLAGSYEGPVISAVLRVVSQAGGRVMAIQTAGSGADYHQGITLKDLAPVGWRKVSGFITVANAVPLAYLESMTEAGKPVVAISNEVPGFNCPAVLPDNVGGVKQAVEHLLEHGHKRIAFVGCLDQFDIRERYEAYRSALREHGVRPNPRLLYHAENNFEHGALSAARAMVAAGLPSTAVVAATDLNAVAVLRSLKEAGYRLPREQAIVGFDDKPDCGLVSPSLSTVSQDLDCLGTLAAELLLEQLAGETVAPGRYVVPTSFVARESCGCAGERKRARRAGPDHEEPVDTYVRAVGEVSGPGTSDSETTVACLSSELSDIYHEVAAAEPTARQLLRLSQICEDLYGHNPCQATYDAILLLASELSERLEGVAASYGPGVAERLAQCTSQVRLSLTKALLDVRNDAYYELRKAIRDEYQITLDLLADHSQDPRLLAWLHSTEARRGVLALWRDNGPRRRRSGPSRFGRRGVAGRRGHVRGLRRETGAQFRHDERGVVPA